LAPLQPMIDDQDVLQRYLLVLHLLKKEPIGRDGTVWEDAKLLVRLRNALVHYRSRWGREINATNLLASLRKLNLPRPPFVSEHQPFFPHQCLGAACAAWAVNASFAFLREFYARLGVPSPFAHIDSTIASLTKASR
jgi:hypothetical protein